MCHYLLTTFFCAHVDASVFHCAEALYTGICSLGAEELVRHEHSACHWCIETTVCIPLLVALYWHCILITFPSFYRT